MKKIIVLAAAVPLLAGCFNLATRPAEITGTYTSPLKYSQYSCEQLAAEVSSLARRENALVAAQNQRRKSGKVQAFWLGYGTGDGIEASELATVRGEKEAARAAMDQQGCGAMVGSHPGTAAGAGAHAPATSNSNWREWGQSAPQDPAKAAGERSN